MTKYINALTLVLARGAGAASPDDKADLCASALARARDARERARLQEICDALLAPAESELPAGSADQKPDAGALARRLAEDFECNSNAVKYVYGIETDGQCGGDCCIDGDPAHPACRGFTGCVTKDGSCNGTAACYGAQVPLIKGGSCVRERACMYAQVPLIKGGSCVGYKACKEMGYYGTVGKVKFSCRGYEACSRVGYGGTVGKMQKSCIGEEACAGMAKYGGSVGQVLKSCKGLEACADMAYQGQAGSVKSSCNKDKACFKVAYVANGYSDDASIGDISGTCNQEKACEKLAYGHVLDADVFRWGATDLLETNEMIETPEDCFTKCEEEGSCTGVRFTNATQVCDLFQGPAGKQDNGDKSNRCGLRRKANMDVCLVKQD